MEKLPLPHDIIMLIGNFAAYRLTNNDLCEIKHKYADITLKRYNKNFRDKWIDYNYTYDFEIDLDDYLYNYTTKTQLEFILDGFIKCECCQRHSYSGKVRNIPKNESNDIICHYTNKQCSCPCRHNGRVILRILENYY